MPGASWIVTIGSTGYVGPLESPPTSLAGCGRMVMLVGTDDTYNSDPTDQFFHALEAKGADVRSVRFNGGHHVPAGPLENVLREILRR